MHSIIDEVVMGHCMREMTTRAALGSDAPLSSESTSVLLCAAPNLSRSLGKW